MSTYNLCFKQKYKKFQFLEVKFSIYLNRRIFFFFFFFFYFIFFFFFRYELHHIEFSITVK